MVFLVWNGHAVCKCFAHYLILFALLVGVHSIWNEIENALNQHAGAIIKIINRQTSHKSCYKDSSRLVFKFPVGKKNHCYRDSEKLNRSFRIRFHLPRHYQLGKAPWSMHFAPWVLSIPFCSLQTASRTQRTQRTQNCAQDLETPRCVKLCNHRQIMTEWERYPKNSLVVSHLYCSFWIIFLQVFSGWKYLKPWMSSPAAGSPQCVQAGTRQGLSLLGARFGMESRCVNSQIWIAVLSLLPGIHPHLDGPVYFPRVRERVDAAYHSPSWPWACCQLSGAKSPHEYPSDLSDTIWWHLIHLNSMWWLWQFHSPLDHWTIGPWPFLWRRRLRLWASVPIAFLISTHVVASGRGDGDCLRKQRAVAILEIIYIIYI